MDRNYSERQISEQLYHDEKASKARTKDGSGRTNRPERHFWNLIGQPRDLTILDFGCGNGWLSVLLGRLGNRVYGIDISGEMIKNAQQLAAASKVTCNTMFIEMAAEGLEFPDASFDMIVGSSILHHTELESTLRNIRKVLKGSGRAIFMEPMNQNIFLRLWRFMTPWRRSKTEKALTAEDIELVRTFFPSTQCVFFCFASIFTEGLLLLMPNSRVVKFIDDRLEDLDERIVKVFPFLGKYSAVVTMEMRK